MLLRKGIIIVAAVATVFLSDSPVVYWLDYMKMLLGVNTDQD